MNSAGHASGTWLPARKVADAATAKLAEIRAWREQGVAAEAEKFAASLWHPFIRDKAAGLAECRRRGLGPYWYIDEETVARDLGEMARVVGRDERGTVFVTASDFRVIAGHYGRRPEPPNETAPGGALAPDACEAASA